MCLLLRVTVLVRQVIYQLPKWFCTTVGVRQGCVISPQLFNILPEDVITTALHGIDISGWSINNLRFADEIVLIAESAKELQTLVTKSKMPLATLV